MFSTLTNLKLFKDIGEKDIDKLLSCLKSIIKSYKKDEFIFLADTSKPAVAIILSGEVKVIKENINGEVMIVGIIKKGEMFAETFACMGLDVIPVSVVATEDSEVIMLDITGIISTCNHSCSFHNQLIANLLAIISEKNLILSKKMSYITHKTIRSRLTAYLEDIAEQKKSHKFVIPYNRNELAEYLCTDRSAMSRELSNMKNEGLIDYDGNSFVIL